MPRGVIRGVFCCPAMRGVFFAPSRAGFSSSGESPSMPHNRPTIDEHGRGWGMITRPPENAVMGRKTQMRGLWISPVVIHRLSTSYPQDRLSTSYPQVIHNRRPTDAMRGGVAGCHPKPRRIMGW